jgi:hypothetical protein
MESYYIFHFFNKISIISVLILSNLSIKTQVACEKDINNFRTSYQGNDNIQVETIREKIAT